MESRREEASRASTLWLALVCFVVLPFAPCAFYFLGPVRVEVEEWYQVAALVFATVTAPAFGVSLANLQDPRLAAAVAAFATGVSVFVSAIILFLVVVIVRPV